eukprot:15364661-Ditylum_brightwellii.AAC.2
MENSNFASACLDSNNFGVSIIGGAHFVSFTMLVECQKYVFRSKRQLCKDNVPKKCLLLLDLTNMLNKMSREKCRQILLADGTLKVFLQFEGFGQGCPLSGMLAALVLGDLFKYINQEQSKHATLLSNPQEAINKLISKIIAFIDDTNIVLSHLNTA